MHLTTHTLSPVSLLGLIAVQPSNRAVPWPESCRLWCHVWERPFLDFRVIWLHRVPWWANSGRLRGEAKTWRPRPECLEAKAEAEVRSSRPRRRLKFWPRCQSGLEALTSLLLSANLWSGTIRSNLNVFIFTIAIIIYACLKIFRLRYYVHYGLIKCIRIHLNMSFSNKMLKPAPQRRSNSHLPHTWKRKYALTAEQYLEKYAYSCILVISMQSINESIPLLRRKRLRCGQGWFLWDACVLPVQVLAASSPGPFVPWAPLWWRRYQGTDPRLSTANLSDTRWISPDRLTPEFHLSADYCEELLKLVKSSQFVSQLCKNTIYIHILFTKELVAK